MALPAAGQKGSLGGGGTLLGEWQLDLRDQLDLGIPVPPGTRMMITNSAGSSTTQTDAAGWGLGTVPISYFAPDDPTIYYEETAITDNVAQWWTDTATGQPVKAFGGTPINGTALGMAWTYFSLKDHVARPGIDADTGVFMTTQPFLEEMRLTTNAPSPVVAESAFHSRYSITPGDATASSYDFDAQVGMLLTPQIIQAAADYYACDFGSEDYRLGIIMKIDSQPSQSFGYPGAVLEVDVEGHGFLNKPNVDVFYKGPGNPDLAATPEPTYTYPVLSNPLGRKQARFQLQGSLDQGLFFFLIREGDPSELASRVRNLGPLTPPVFGLSEANQQTPASGEFGSLEGRRAATAPDCDCQDPGCLDPDFNVFAPCTPPPGTPSSSGCPPAFVTGGPFESHDAHPVGKACGSPNGETVEVAVHDTETGGFTVKIEVPGVSVSVTGELSHNQVLTKKIPSLTGKHKKGQCVIVYHAWKAVANEWVREKRRTDHGLTQCVDRKSYPTCVNPWYPTVVCDIP